MTRLYLIRHAMVDCPPNTFSQFSTPLSREGVAYAEKQSAPKVDLVLTSPMTRTIQTAKILFPNTQIEEEPLLVEKSNGIAEGKAFADADLATVNKAPFLQRQFPKGESLQDVQVRAQQFLDKVRKSPHKSIAAVTHGTFIRVLLSILQGKDLEEQIKNTSIDFCQEVIVDI